MGTRCPPPVSTRCAPTGSSSTFHTGLDQHLRHGLLATAGLTDQRQRLAGEYLEHSMFDRMDRGSHAAKTSLTDRDVHRHIVIADQHVATFRFRKA